jgi:hypothetical protein
MLWHQFYLKLTINSGSILAEHLKRRRMTVRTERGRTEESEEEQRSQRKNRGVRGRTEESEEEQRSQPLTQDILANNNFRKKIVSCQGLTPYNLL